MQTSDGDTAFISVHSTGQCSVFRSSLLFLRAPPPSAKHNRGIQVRSATGSGFLRLFLFLERFSQRSPFTSQWAEGLALIQHFRESVPRQIQKRFCPATWLVGAKW